MTPREAAFLTIQKAFRDDKYLNIEVSNSINKYKFEDKDKSFYSALVYGTFERLITIDNIISHYSDEELGKLDQNVLSALRIGICQTHFMDKIPDHAAVSETVELCDRFYSKKNSKNYVNAVLRAAIKDRDNWHLPGKDNLSKYLSIKYSVSEWICSEWIDTYGEEKAEKMLSSTFSHPKITVCTNTLRITREELLEKLTSDGIKCKESDLTPNGILLLENVPYEVLSDYDEYMFVQDEASQLCCAALDAQPGENIMDACSCPGGKSFGAALSMKNKGRIDSCDLHINKLSLVEKGADRLGIEIIFTKAKNSTAPFVGMYDRILCDVPCSGLGVISKKPEIRYKKKEDIEKLPKVQYSILNNCSLHVKEGGVLVYSTCTLRREENQNIIEKFLSENSSFELTDFECCGKQYSGMTELSPYSSTTDGFFIAKMTKKGNNK